MKYFNTWLLVTCLTRVGCQLYRVLWLRSALSALAFKPNVVVTFEICLFNSLTNFKLWGICGQWVHIYLVIVFELSHFTVPLEYLHNRLQWNPTLEDWVVAKSDHIHCSWLTYWGRATHICVSKLTIIASDNGLSPNRRQAIWNNAGILSIGLSWTNFSEILIAILTFSFNKMRFKVSSAKWRPFCLGLNVLKWQSVVDASYWHLFNNQNL